MNENNIKSSQYGFKLFNKNIQPIIKIEDTFNYWSLLWKIPLRILFYLFVVFIIWFYITFPIQLLWLIFYIPVMLVVLDE